MFPGHPQLPRFVGSFPPIKATPGAVRFKRNSPVAFSLVEVAIAIAVISFGLVPLLGIMPVGLGAFHDANDTSVMTQITQRIISELQQTDFDQLIRDKDGNVIAAGATGVKANRFFDDQGNEIVSSTRPSNAIYQVNTRVAADTPLPNGAGNDNLATVTLQIAKSPNGANLVSSAQNNLWQPVGGASVCTFSTLVARNK